MRDGEERHRLEAAAASAEEEARRWDAIARRIDGIGDEARPLLADVVESWRDARLDLAAPARRALRACSAASPPPHRRRPSSRPDAEGLFSSESSARFKNVRCDQQL